MPAVLEPPGDGHKGRGSPIGGYLGCSGRSGVVELAFTFIHEMLVAVMLKTF